MATATETTMMTPPPETVETDTAWLRALEDRVHAAAVRIRDLRQEKGELERRIQELEAHLAAQPGDLDVQLAEQRDENAALRRAVQELEARLAAAPSPQEATRWAEEREEIRGRVTRLVDHLEALMAD